MAAVGMGIILATIDGSIVNIALPTWYAPLTPNSLPYSGWFLPTCQSTLMLSVGRLGDMLGKPLYAAGFVVFTAGSVLCGLSPSISWLIAFTSCKPSGAMLMA
jgi:MFS family permease